MKKVVLLLSVILLLIIQSCENHAHDHDENHQEPVGFFLKSSGVQLVEYRAPNDPTGSIVVPVGDETDLITVSFISEDGDEFTPDVPEYSLQLETASSHFEFEQHAEDGKWRFHVKGLTVGTGTFVLKLMHNDHADFTSRPVTVTVQSTNL